MQLAFSEEPNIPVRVGIHSGDIIFTEDDIIGDGVNVASRIESLAVTGSVFISGKVYDEVKNQAGIRTEPMGIFELKNVEQPIQVYAVSTPGLVVPERVHMAGKLKDSADRRHKTGQSGFQKSTLFWILVPALFVIAALLLYFTGILDYNSTGFPDQDPEITQKSIAVLPFINDSDDSSNIYMVNGLMESILNNLQKIGELRVISRTSVEKYRNRPKLIPEIARELNVKYLVEGSGQKIGDQIKLSIQLIDAPNDRHLWSEQYSRGTEDIFALQGEIAQRIAEQIKVFITPEEQERIKKVLTENMKAYDYYLQALHYMFSLEDANQKKAIELFHEAAAEDDNFAAAWANIALAYYNLDRYRSEKIYADSIDKYADKALLLDPQLAQSLIAKAYSHINAASWEEAVPYLQKALEYNPNSSLVFNILMDFYANHYPDTEKYLEYALKAIRLDIASRDSVSASFIYLHVSNAFIQSGFVDEAQEYINKSLSLYPENTYSLHLKAYIRYAVTRDLERLKESLLEVFQMDTTRLDLLQEIAKTCYYLRDYECAFTYYDRVCKVRRDNGLDIFRGEDAKIGFVFAKMGRIGESEQLFNAYRQYAENDETVYKHLSLAVYQDHLGNTEEALDHFQAFADQQNHSYWIVLFLEMDPLLEKLINLPEGRKILDKIERDFKKHHQEVRSALVDEGLV
jgi:TolB-like protein